MAPLQSVMVNSNCKGSGEGIGRQKSEVFAGFKVTDSFKGREERLKAMLDQIC